MLIFGGGTLVLDSLIGIWLTFGIVVGVASLLAVGSAVQGKRACAREQRELENVIWKRTLWEEWGYRSE